MMNLQTRSVAVLFLLLSVVAAVSVGAKAAPYMSAPTVAMVASKEPQAIDKAYLSSRRIKDVGEGDLIMGRVGNSDRGRSMVVTVKRQQQSRGSETLAPTYAKYRLGPGEEKDSAVLEYFSFYGGTQTWTETITGAEWK